MIVGGFNLNACEFNPLIEMDRRLKVEAFLNDPEPSMLRSHSLNSEDITTLWQTHQPLCASVIQRIHHLFEIFFTDEFAVKGKRSGVTWNCYKNIIRLGANEFAAKNGSHLAADLVVYASESGLIARVEKITEYFSIAIAKSCPYSYYLYGTLNRRRFIRPPTQERRLEHITFAAKKGVPQAQYELALRKLSIKVKRGITALEVLANKGLAEAQFRLSQIYFDCSLVCADIEKSAHYLLLAANQGYCPAINNIGFYHEFDLGFLQNDIRAVDCFLKAAKYNFAPAQKNLAYCYQYGIGVISDLKAAERWRQSSKTGEQHSTALLLENEEDVFFAELVKKDAEWYQIEHRLPKQEECWF
jgi:hypothetical protein